MSKKNRNTNPSDIQLAIPQLRIPFESIKHIDDDGNEYWYARELMPVYEYSRWENFSKSISKAIISCNKSGSGSDRHFLTIAKKVELGNSVIREIDDYKLSRLACYLIAMNSDASKAIIAEAQLYFASQTRRQELADEQAKLETTKSINAYLLKGFDEDRATARVESKQSQKELTNALLATHEEHTPNFGEIGAIQNRGLFDMSKAEIVKYFGLLPKDEDKYRDRLGYYALTALKEANKACAKRMKSMKRELTTDEQAQIVHDVVYIIGPTFRDLAAYAGEDYLSGASIDDNGRILINRNVPLIGGGNE